MFKYSYDALVYYGEKVSDSIARVAKFGYDALELVGEPDYYDTDEINKLKAEYEIEISSVCSVYSGDERDLAHPDKAIRDKAIDYVRSVVDLASAVGCPTIIAAPTAVGKNYPLASREEELEWAVASLRTAADYAADRGVNLCLEAWNRYETYWLNRLDQAVELLRIVDKPNVGVMGDTFHMNIDEADMASAIGNTGKDLIHIHLADSNRAAPGEGHTDFKPILQMLKQIEYQGYLTFELLPASSDPFAVMRAGGATEFFDKYTESAIKNIKAIEAAL
jgi:sugar phosphate isomerase/epimerase